MTRYRSDRAAAARVVDFFRLFLRHVKGEWAGRPFLLQRWQRDRVVRPLFGARLPDGTRRYRTALLEVARKNGKSALAAGIALYLLFADDEEGAEIYSAAADREQAAIVFNVASRMVLRSRALSKRAKIYRRSIVVPASGSAYHVLSADAPTKHGINASAVIFDELHAQPNRDLWDVLTTSTGARRQPLTLALTTAGFDEHSIAAEVHQYAEQVAAGEVRDDSFLPVIYSAPADAPLDQVRTWKAANPSLGITVKKAYLATEARKAQHVPAYENTFRRLHLNQWTAQAVRWMPMTKWDACAAPVDEPSLVGRPCYAGLDLASTIDLAALGLVFPADDGTYDVQVRFWCPEEGLADRARRDRVPYEVWARQGFLEPTPGAVIDFARILDRIKLDAGRYQFKEVAFDRWGASRISQDLADAGLTVIQFGQGFASMSPPTKELLNLVLARKIRHGGHPVLRWNANNVVVDLDAAGNVKPSKRKSREKIDGVVAMIMALDRAVRHEVGPRGSIYARRGLVVMQ